MKEQPLPGSKQEFALFSIILDLEKRQGAFIKAGAFIWIKTVCVERLYTSVAILTLIFLAFPVVTRRQE